jgi:PRTRC genetic system protein B
MKTSVNIGSSQDFSLSRALLVYGNSNYNGFPARHPFITLHEVIHESSGARLSEAQLVTPNMLMDLIASLEKPVPLEILPERVLVRTAETIVWWRPAGVHSMFFSDRGGDATLKSMNGKRYPHPSLLFKACGPHLSIRALAHNERPKIDTKIYMDPYWNCADNGAVCMEAPNVAQKHSLAVIDAWEDAFFRSEFTHAGGVQKRTHFPEGVLAMWQSLKGKPQFPPEYLVQTKQTLIQFASDHDTSHRNDANV